MTAERHYWEAVAGVWEESKPQALWRMHSDAVNCTLAARWLPGRIERLLKTDLFDEAVGGGLYPVLATRAQEIIGIDLSILTLRTARFDRPVLQAAGADVRHLPFADGVFDAIVSNSTLDHFASVDEITASLGELGRVLQPGGCLLLTIDNLANPLIALRQVLPFRLLNRLGLVPYYVGVTLAPRRLRRALKAAGLETEQIGAVMHCPRVLAVLAARMLQRAASPAVQARFLRFLMAFECLAHWPTRFLTGYFLAVRATRKGSSFSNDVDYGHRSTDLHGSPRV